MFYYFGLFQVSETTVFALGLNNNEVIYLGANELFVLVINLLDKIFSFIQTYWVQVFYCTYYPFFIWFWWKPETNEKKKLKLKILYYSIAFDFKNKNLFPKNILASKVSTFILSFYIYIFLFLIFISCYLGFYHRGVNDFSESLKTAQLQASLLSVQLHPPITLINRIGVLNENNKEIYVYNLACGNYKCAGINVSSFQLRTYLPENYSISIPEKYLKNTI